MIILEPISIANVKVFRSVRLRALQDAPSAFGSTYARESQFTDAEWIKRTMLWNGERGIGFLALDGSVACGLAGTFLDAEDARQANLISMWTAPTHRQTGVGRLLVNSIVSWAFQRGARRLQLMVTSNNQSATLFYQRLGFTFTGRIEPYPNDSSLFENEMSRPLSSETL
jgi:ribosomal protein S18 acetylase RimI-like enzyme